MGKGEAMEKVTIRTGKQKDYLTGLDNLRKLVTNIELDVDKLNRQFCGSVKHSDGEYAEYLKSCNDKLLYCNNQMRKKHIPLQIIDSEVKLVSMLNKVREIDKFNTDVISALTEFWENLKENIEGVKTIRRKFTNTCLKGLKSTCISYQDHGDIRLELSTTYSEAVNDYLAEISDILKKIDKLTKLYTLEVQQDLLTKTSFSNRILLSCDQEAFPLLCLVPDLSEKLMTLSRIATQWIDKDETYVHDINKYIREKRLQTHKKGSNLRQKREKQEHLSTSVDDAYHMFKNNKSKLAKIESELETLANSVNGNIDSKRNKEDEINEKEGMVVFLDISISQMRKNYTLQLKRSRLMRQVRELEESLKSIEQDLATMEKDMNEKVDEKLHLKETVVNNNKSYTALKQELQDINNVVEDLQREVEELSDSLTQLEIIQSVKTCPEKVEDLYERPATVKLAPSLKEKILHRRQRIINPALMDQ